MYKKWSDLVPLTERKYNCGFCNSLVSTNKGYVFGSKQYSSYVNISKEIYICPNCNKPTFYDVYKQKYTPGIKYGIHVEKLPKDIAELYDEARNVYSVNAFTSVAMVTRKIIMNTAVKEGAKENLNYIEYVDYLDKKNIIPKNAKGWLDKLRKIGNVANHKIEHITKEQAEEAIKFVEILLKNVFELSVVEKP